MRRRLAEISSSEKSMWNSITAQEQEACRDFVPMLGQSTRTAIYFGAPGARQGQVLFDARLGRSHRRLLPAQGRNARMQQRYRCRPGAQSEETGTMGQLYYPAAFFSYPAIMYFTAGVAGRSRRSLHRSAPHVEGELQARKKKSVGSWFVAESAPFGGVLS